VRIMKFTTAGLNTLTPDKAMSNVSVLNYSVFYYSTCSVKLDSAEY